MTSVFIFSVAWKKETHTVMTSGQIAKKKKKKTWNPASHIHLHGNVGFIQINTNQYRAD